MFFTNIKHYWEFIDNVFDTEKKDNKIYHKSKIENTKKKERN